MWSLVPPEHWTYLQMISRPLREDTRHAAAAVVDMRDAYRSFQAEVVKQIR